MFVFVLPFKQNSQFHVKARFEQPTGISLCWSVLLAAFDFGNAA